MPPAAAVPGSRAQQQESHSNFELYGGTPLRSHGSPANAVEANPFGGRISLGLREANAGAVAIEELDAGFFQGDDDPAEGFVRNRRDRKGNTHHGDTEARRKITRRALQDDTLPLIHGKPAQVWLVHTDFLLVAHILARFSCSYFFLTRSGNACARISTPENQNRVFWGPGPTA